MGLTLAGVFPISIINPGLAASPPVFTGRISELQKLVIGYGKAAIDQVALKARVAASLASPTPLSLATFQAAIASLLASYADPINSPLKPVKFSANAAGSLGDLSSTLAALLVQKASIQAVEASFSLGLSAQGIAAWSFFGPAPLLASSFSLIRSWGTVKPTDGISAGVMMAFDVGPWSVLGQSVNTGGTETATSATGLKFLGLLDGASLNTGVKKLSIPVARYLQSLNAQEAALGYQIKFCTGLSLPSVPALTSALGALNVPQVYQNMLSLSLDFTAPVASLVTQIASLNASLASVQTQLSTDGIRFYSYGGPAQGLGAAFKETFSSGVPNNPKGPNANVYALILAGNGPSWSALSSILKVG